MFDSLPVRGAIVRLTDAWREVVQRRAANTDRGAYPAPVVQLLGEMTAAACLMQANIKFNGTLQQQMQGSGAATCAVCYRATQTANVSLHHGRWCQRQ